MEHELLAGQLFGERDALVDMPPHRLQRLAELEVARLERRQLGHALLDDPPR
ncbi:hypothetical protein D3C83_235450 [compost metagenome]